MTTLSPKFQVVIPLKIRNELGLTAGMKIEMVAYKNRIELIPLMPIKKLEGTLKGINTTITREKDRI